MHCDTTRLRKGVPRGGALSIWWYIKIGMVVLGMPRVFLAQGKEWPISFINEWLLMFGKADT